MTAFYASGLKQTTMLKLQSGSSGEPLANHLIMNEGTTCRYGYLNDIFGNSMPNVNVQFGQYIAVTNSDGFYLIDGLTIGETVNLSVYQNGIEIIANYQITIGDGLGGII